MFGGALPSRASDIADLQRWTQGPQPSFILPDTAGADVALAAERGHVVLVHFFATWCEPCREELPALNRLTARANGKLEVLAISVAEVDLRVRRFLETMPLDFPVLLDRDRVTAKAWRVSTLPTTFVLDGNLNPKLVVKTNFAWDSVDPVNLAGMLAVNARDRTATTNTNIQSSN
jgi:thiol-disulfide isomerase/thioredoxin